jgi:hypothetical protein
MVVTAKSKIRLTGHGAFVFEPDGGPLAFVDMRPGQPVHVHAEVVQMQAARVNSQNGHRNG